jgi:hypothetical protein
MRRFAPVVVALALAGCGSEPPNRETEHDVYRSFHELSDQAAASLQASERFKSDLLDVRGIMDRTGRRTASTASLERELRDALARHGLHVLARTDPRPPERAAVAIQIHGLIDDMDGDPKRGSITHFDAAVESETSVGPARIIWSFQCTFPEPSTLPDEYRPAGWVDKAALDAQMQLAPHLEKVEAVQVTPVADRTSKFPVLPFDACLRHHLVSSGIPVVWRRAAGVDAPIGMGAASSPEKRADLPSINGEVTEAPGGGAILVLKLERVNPATKKLEVVAQFDRKLATP